MHVVRRCFKLRAALFTAPAPAPAHGDAHHELSMTWQSFGAWLRTVVSYVEYGFGGSPFCFIGAFMSRDGGARGAKDGVSDCYETLGGSQKQCEDALT